MYIIPIARATVDTRRDTEGRQSELLQNAAAEDSHPVTAEIQE